MDFCKPGSRANRHPGKKITVLDRAWVSQNRDPTFQAAPDLCTWQERMPWKHLSRLTLVAGSFYMKSVLVLTSLAEVSEPHKVPLSCPLSSSSDSLTQGNFFQQVEIALKEVIANGFVKDKGHAMSTEFIVSLLPAGSKGKMGSQVGHGEGADNYSYRERELAWLFLWISLLFQHELETVILNQPLSIYIRRGCHGGVGEGQQTWKVKLLAHPPSNDLGDTASSQQVLSKDENRLSEILLHPGKSNLPSLLAMSNREEHNVLTPWLFALIWFLNWNSLISISKHRKYFAGDSVSWFPSLVLEHRILKLQGPFKVILANQAPPIRAISPKSFHRGGYAFPILGFFKGHNYMKTCFDIKYPSLPANQTLHLACSKQRLIMYACFFFSLYHGDDFPHKYSVGFCTSDRPSGSILHSSHTLCTSEADLYG